MRLKRLLWIGIIGVALYALILLLVYFETEPVWTPTNVPDLKLNLAAMDIGTNRIFAPRPSLRRDLKKRLFVQPDYELIRSALPAPAEGLRLWFFYKDAGQFFTESPERQYCLLDEHGCRFEATRIIVHQGRPQGSFLLEFWDYPRRLSQFELCLEVKAVSNAFSLTITNPQPWSPAPMELPASLTNNGMTFTLEGIGIDLRSQGYARMRPQISLSDKGKPATNWDVSTTTFFEPGGGRTGPICPLEPVLVLRVRADQRIPGTNIPPGLRPTVEFIVTNQLLNL